MLHPKAVALLPRPQECFFGMIHGEEWKRSKERKVCISTFQFPGCKCRGMSKFPWRHSFIALPQVLRCLNFWCSRKVSKIIPDSFIQFTAYKLPQPDCHSYTFFCLDHLYAPPPDFSTILTNTIRSNCDGITHIIYNRTQTACCSPETDHM